MYVQPWIIYSLLVTITNLFLHLPQTQCGEYSHPKMRGFDHMEVTQKVDVKTVRSIPRPWSFPGSMTLQFTGAFNTGSKTDQAIVARNTMSRLEFYYATGKTACQNNQCLVTVRDEALKSEQTNAPEDKVRYFFYISTKKKQSYSKASHILVFVQYI